MWVGAPETGVVCLARPSKWHRSWIGPTVDSIIIRLGAVGRPIGFLRSTPGRLSRLAILEGPQVAEQEAVRLIDQRHELLSEPSDKFLNSQPAKFGPATVLTFQLRS